MRTKEEVQAEIDWREKEIEEILKQPTKTYREVDYNQWRISNLRTSIEWCKWFLNE